MRLRKIREDAFGEFQTQLFHNEVEYFDRIVWLKDKKAIWSERGGQPAVRKLHTII